MVALSPLAVDTGVFFPYVEGKTVLIRTLVCVAWVLYVVALFLKRDFFERAIVKVKTIIRTPIFLTMSGFMAVIGLSALTAFFQYRAFFGDIERGEGLIGLVFLFAFFVLASFVFERKDWLIFFKISLGVGLVMFVHGVIQYFGGNTRPGSFTGNPIYLAGYFLFLIFAALAVFRDSGGRRFWKWASLGMIPVSLAGVLLTQTRGVILGIAAGAVISLIVWGLTSGRSYRGWSAKKMTTAALALLLLLGGFAYVTRGWSLWSKIPGISRLVGTESNDMTLRTRLLSIGISLNAINPANEGIKRFLFGWGPENFQIAYNKYYNPEYFRYEKSWFDRAHDKLLDVLVMHGTVGLVVYLLLWFFIARAVFRIRKKSGFLFVSGLFFTMAYFVQNLTVFESLPTYIALYSFIAFLNNEGPEATAEGSPSSKLTAEGPKNVTGEKSASWKYLLPFSATAVSLAALLGGATLPAFFQMHSYHGVRNQQMDVGTFISEGSQRLVPYTYAQENIRLDFLTVAEGTASKFGINGDSGRVTQLMDKALQAMNELVQKEPYNPRYFLRIAQSYNMLSQQPGGDQKLLVKGEEMARAALALAPQRQDIGYLLGYNLLLQGRQQESLALYRKIYESDPTIPSSNYYLGMTLATVSQNNYPEALPYLEFSLENGFKGENEDALNQRVYEVFVQYFYNRKDAERFSVVVSRLEKMGIVPAAAAKRVINAAKSGQWASAKFWRNQ